MISKKVAQQVKELEIHTRKVLKGSHIGGQQSRQKGFGFEFDQLRAYQHGDDVRLIDWKSSAKNQNNLFIRQYHEERNRTFMLCLDVSFSTNFGSQGMLKQEVMKQITGVLALAAEYGKDKVGLILFSDKIEKVIPPAKGKQHTHHLIETIFSYKPDSAKTDLNVLFQHVTQNRFKHAIIFIISDFIVSDYEKTLKQVAMNKEIIALSCVDDQEIELANIGLVWMLDSESNDLVLVDTRHNKQNSMQKALQNRLIYHRKIMQKHKVDFVQIRSKKNFIHDLIMFFQKRLAY